MHINNGGSGDMSPTRPYFIRALNDWIVDNELTPYLLVDATDERNMLPSQFIEDGKIILNIAPIAIRGLDITNKSISFKARFSGVVEQVYVTMASVMAIYAKENGRGMAFEDDYYAEEQEDDDDSPPPTKGGNGRGHLKVVK